MFVEYSRHNAHWASRIFHLRTDTIRCVYFENDFSNWTKILSKKKKKKGIINSNFFFLNQKLLKKSSKEKKFQKLLKILII